MFPIDKCMQTLRILIAEHAPNGIVLAERAVNEFITAHEGPNRQTGALHVLEQELNPIWLSAKGEQLSFVNVVIDYVGARVRALHDRAPT